MSAWQLPLPQSFCTCQHLGVWLDDFCLCGLQTCAALNFRDKQIEYYDSLGGVDRATIQGLMRWVQDEYKDKYGKAAPPEFQVLHQFLDTLRAAKEKMPCSRPNSRTLCSQVLQQFFTASCSHARNEMLVEVPTKFGIAHFATFQIR
jgi:hypothetical protein